MISSLRRPRSAWAGRGLTGRVGFSPGIALGIHTLRSFSPVARVRRPLGLREPTCRFRHGPVAGSGVRFFVPRSRPQQDDCVLGLAAFGFWALTPSTSRAMSIAGPAIASIRMGRSIVKAAAAMGFQVLSQVLGRKPDPRTRCCLRVNGRAGECEPRARFCWPSLPGRHFWRLSAHALWDFPHRQSLGSGVIAAGQIRTASAC